MAAKKISAVLRISAWLVLFGMPWAFAPPRYGGRILAQTRQEPNSARMDAAIKRFGSYGRDFLDFAKSSEGDSYSREWETAMSLHSVASEIYEHLSTASVLLDIYNDLTCPGDKARAKVRIESQLNFYGLMTNFSIEQANSDIATTRKPGVAAEAIRMRDDLREAKSLLEGVKLP
jgi:hypothetical protein